MASLLRYVPAVEFTKVGELGDLERHGQFSRWINDHDVLVYRLDGRIKAVSNICPHFGGPIGFHKLKDGRFTCLWHNFQFSSQNGTCLDHAGLTLREYKVKVEKDSILVALAEN